MYIGDGGTSPLKDDLLQISLWLAISAPAGQKLANNRNTATTHHPPAAATNHDGLTFHGPLLCRQDTESACHPLSLSLHLLKVAVIRGYHNQDYLRAGIIEVV